MRKLILVTMFLLTLAIPSRAIAAPFMLDFFPPPDGGYIFFYPRVAFFKPKIQGITLPDWFYTTGILFRPAYAKSFDKGRKIFATTFYFPIIDYSRFLGENKVGIGDLSLVLVLWPFEKQGRTTHLVLGSYFDFPTCTNDHFKTKQYGLRPVIALAQSFGKKIKLEDEFQFQYHFGNNNDSNSILNDFVISYEAHAKALIGAHVNLAFDVRATNPKRKYVDAGASVRFLVSPKFHTGLRIMYPVYYDNIIDGLTVMGLFGWKVF
jgi:hypothetical protein